MWRWIAAVTVLVGTFGLGMWSAFCIDAPRASIDIVWEPDQSWQRQGVDFDFEVATSAPTYAREQCPSASNEPNKICTVDALPCPEPLPENVQRVVEIARSRPSAAAGTIFDDTANDVAFVEALTEVAEKNDRTSQDWVTCGNDAISREISGEETLPAPACETNVADSLPETTLLTVPVCTLAHPDVATSNCALGTKEGCPLTVNDATGCAEKATCDATTCETTAGNKSTCVVTRLASGADCDTATCNTAACNTATCETATCTAGVCESTCDQACAKECSSAEAVTALLYERAREMDAKAWELEEVGEYGLADRLRDIASEMRGSARVARQAATGLR